MMTLEEAIEELERLLSHWDDLENGKRSFRWYSKDAVEVALSALRPVSREQVEQIKGVWIFNDDWWEFRCSECHKGIGNIEKYKFCPHCGAPMTDEAMDILLKRLEALKNEEV